MPYFFMRPDFPHMKAKASTKESAVGTPTLGDASLSKLEAQVLRVATQPQVWLQVRSQTCSQATADAPRRCTRARQPSRNPFRRDAPSSSVRKTAAFSWNLRPTSRCAPRGSLCYQNLSRRFKHSVPALRSLRLPGGGRTTIAPTAESVMTQPSRMKTGTTKCCCPTSYPSEGAPVCQRTKLGRLPPAQSSR